MGTIDDYLDELDPADRAVVEHVYDVVQATVPDLEQGKSYGMPALLYRGKALISVIRTRKHFGVYPYSGRVPAIVAESVDDLDYDKGTIRFQPERPLSDDTIRAIVAARVAEIDDPSLRRRTQPG
ncbi:iron chaperone [Micropruina sp.]|uniref:iron chaperone n=1 Tax=Micropruina sp. TaxID=2737536 RepID=UPI0039E62EE3